MKKILILIATLMSVLYSNVDEIEDPYKNIEYFVLENGLQVYILSHKNAVNTNISMEINVGWDIEDDDNYGLSHLVEHMVFRDKRIPHRDYLDYMKEEGASYVNGYTSRYDTEITATIDSNKSYWITELFAQMIFDKNVNASDIETEKGAVQVEIGEKVWYDRLMSSLKIIKDIVPKQESFYNTHFGLKDAKDLPHSYLEKVNNKRFTLDDVMAHYNTYYYPSNMTLKISGNFDTKKMKKVVKKFYAQVDKKGIERTYKPKGDAVLSNKVYVHYREGIGKNYGYIGTQYLFDDCQKHIILNAFMQFVSTKIQQQLRNKDGKSYTVSKYSLQSRGAGVVAISFDGLHDDFDNNIQIVKENIQKYVENMDDESIDEALAEYKKRYTSIEFDSSSLSSLINKTEHMRSDHNIEDTTHYEFFKTITPQTFRDVVKESCIPSNAYSVIYRDYFLFTGDLSLLVVALMFMLIYLYVTYSHWVFIYKGVHYTKREVILSHHIGNRFAGFMTFIFIIFLSSLIYAWVEHLAMKYIMDDVNYLYTLDLPYSIYVGTFDTIVSTILMFSIYRWMVVYHASIDVTSKRLYILGSNPLCIDKASVKSVELVPWKVNMLFKTTGFAFFFWRPLLEIKTKTKTYYVRSSNAEQLRVDLVQRWMYV